ncbi:MAG: DUF3887 domain-containing protein [Proteobacteria bacterium]|nr:DUF3887 domain-containing protein [Pseudomonadota bacterium]
MMKVQPLLCATLLAAGGVAHAQVQAAPANPIQPPNAADAHAAAAAIEACNAKMMALLAALDQHDYPGAVKDFDDTMRAGLTSDKLQQVWESLPARFGTPGPRGTPHNSTSGGYTVITVPMQFQNGSLAAQIACGADGRIAGFHVMTLSPTQPAAGSSAAPAAASTAH